MVIGDALGFDNNRIVNIVLTAGSNVTLNTYNARKIGNLLFLYVRFTVASGGVAAYGTIVTHGYKALTGWHQPVYTDGGLVIANKGVYADRQNTTVRSSDALSAGTYRISAIIPVE